MLCEYGCGNEAKFLINKSKKWCCCQRPQSQCNFYKIQLSEIAKIRHALSNGKFTKTKQDRTSQKPAEFCEFGCGNSAEFYSKQTDKWRCKQSVNSCSAQILKNKTINKERCKLYVGRTLRTKEQESKRIEASNAKCKGKTYEDMYGLEKAKLLKKNSSIRMKNKKPYIHTEEDKKKISDKMRGNRNGNHRGDRQNYYNDIRFDSNWEVGVAGKYFDSNHIVWKYNEKGYVLNDGQVYYQDFFIYENNNLRKLIEVKGYFREANKIKFARFKTEYPFITIELWEKNKLVDLGIINRSGYVI